MGMTMTQKILAKHAGLDEVKAGQLIEANLDLVLGNDVTAPVAIGEMKKMNVDCVFCKDKIALVPDHFTPNKDIKSAELYKCVKDFAEENQITNYFETGRVGIEHALLPEKGLVVAGDVVIGADSHTCTYGALGAFSTGVGSTDMAAGMATGKAWFKVPSAIKFNLTGKPAKWVSGKDVILHIIGLIGVDGALYRSMEFVGDGIKYLSMDDRFAMTNMAIEAGGKNGIFPVDDLTIEYMKEHSTKEYTVYEADEDAEYDEEYTIDLSTLRPTVAFPHLPENTRTIDEVGDVKIDQVVIGSCTNGRIEDMRIAAEIMKGKNEIRLSLTYNHFNKEHIFVSDETLISIDQMKINYCIYDLIDIFQNHDELYESLPLLEYYLKEVKLLKEEKILIQCILSIVPQVQLNLQEEVNIYQMSKLICYLDGLQEIFKKLMIDEK